MRDLIAHCIRDRDWRCRLISALGLAVLIVVVIYGRVALSLAPAPVRLVVYAFSTQEEVLTQSIFPAFEAAWEAETGQALTIQGVFGPSEILAGQINLGAPAELALFSSTQHVTHLKVGRRVRAYTQPVVVAHTPMVIVTRPGNPRAIAAFSDLAQPGLNLLHADPRTAGAGQWAVLAEYGSALPEAGERAATGSQGAGDASLRSEQAEAQLEAIWQNVRLLGTSARATMTLFELGAGDAFVTYEHDALLAQDRGAALEIVVPPQTIVAQHVAVIVDDNVTASSERRVAEALLDYLVSEAGQQALNHYHLRPAAVDGEQLPEIPQAFGADNLGGWSRAYTDLVEGLWQAEIEPRLYLDSVLRVLDTEE